MNRTTISLAAALTTVFATAISAQAETLGCRSVGFINDTDVIAVGRDAGKFRSVQLRVTGNDIEVRDLKIVYGNGSVDDIPVRSLIRAGGETRWIDLKGDKRFIKDVVMTYASKPSFKGQAKVCVFAR